MNRWKVANQVVHIRRFEKKKREEKKKKKKRRKKKRREEEEKKKEKKKRRRKKRRKEERKRRKEEEKIRAPRDHNMCPVCFEFTNEIQLNEALLERTLDPV